MTPFLSSYLVFSVITVFKMIAAGGTDCAQNVWILELWPGKDAWLQALHFSFAVGCALGPLLVEPFLSVDYNKDNGEMDKINGKTSGHAKLDDLSNETRIHIPYAISGMSSVVAGCYILYLYFRERERNRKDAKLKAKQQAASSEHILLNAIQHPAALEAGQATIIEEDEEEEEEEEKEVVAAVAAAAAAAAQKAKLGDSQQSKGEEQTTRKDSAVEQQYLKRNPQAKPDDNSSDPQKEQALEVPKSQTPLPLPHPPVKITSKAKDHTIGRPPYYVMLAIALAAMCLSFYCGIEITSMNYLATFAVNIELQLPKSTAALMSSALTISFAVGRGFGIWIAVYMKPHKLFYLCAGVMATGNILMLIFANTAERLLWYSICLFGIGCGPMYPAIVSFYDDRIAKVTNTVSGIFILGSMFNVALNSLIIGHHIIDNALILLVCNLIGSVLLLLLFGTLHMLTKVKKHQRVKKFRLQQQATGAITVAAAASVTPSASATTTTSQIPPHISASDLQQQQANDKQQQVTDALLTKGAEQTTVAQPQSTQVDLGANQVAH